MNKEGTALNSEAEKYLRGVGMMDVKFTQDRVVRKSMRMERTWKEQGTELTTRIKELKEECRRDGYKTDKRQASAFSIKMDKES